MEKDYKTIQIENISLSDIEENVNDWYVPNEYEYLTPTERLEDISYFDMIEHSIVNDIDIYFRVSLPESVYEEYVKDPSKDYLISDYDDSQVIHDGLVESLHNGTAVFMINGKELDYEYENGEISLLTDSIELADNEELLLRGMKHELSILKYASEELRADKNFILEAIKQHGCALKYASIELQNDKEVVMTAVHGSSVALYFASKNLKNDKEFILDVVKQYGASLEHASKELQGDREVVLTAVSNYKNSIYYASPALQEAYKGINEEQAKKLLDELTHQKMESKKVLIGRPKEDGLSR